MVKNNEVNYIHCRYAKPVLLFSILILTSLDNHLEKYYSYF